MPRFNWQSIFYVYASSCFDAMRPRLDRYRDGFFYGWASNGLGRGRCDGGGSGCHLHQKIVFPINDRLALSAVRISYGHAPMFARYFFRVALIFAAVLSMVQPAQASGTVAVGAWWYVGQYVGDTNSFKSTPALTCQYIKDIYYSNDTGWSGYNPEVTNVTSTTFSCSIRTAGGQFAFSGSGNKGGDVCPANSTGTTTCTCTDPYIPNAGATACEMPPVVCPAAGTVLSSGLYDVGTVPKMLANMACAGGCLVLFGGSINSTSIVNGVKHYYADGDYVYNGYPFVLPASPTCPADTQAGTSTVSAPSSTCAAGQNYGFVNGAMRCLASDGSIVSTDSASAVAAAQTLADARIAAQIAAAGSAVAAAGGSVSDVAAAQSVAAGVAAAAAGAAGTNPDPVQAAFCAENPTASICVASDFGSVDDSALTDQVKNVAITPVSVGGAGSCPVPSVMVLHGHTYYFEWTTYCNFANMIKPVLLAFAWLAAAGILVGGFVA